MIKEDIHSLDQKDRVRFCEQIDQNFSVIASAGAGKTQAIVDRIISIAKNDSFLTEPCLPKLVVVTYTRKAAREMQERVKNKLLQDSVAPSILANFNQVFFGTIHSFCMMLIKKFGYLIGVSSKIELLEDVEELFLEYVREQDSLPIDLNEHDLKKFLRLVRTQDIFNLAKKISPKANCKKEALPFPVLNFDAIFSYDKATKRTEATVHKFKDKLNEWVYDLEKSEEIISIPNCKKGGAEFISLWNQSFKDLKDWVGNTISVVANNVSVDFREFRLKRGYATYDDMIFLAHLLLSDSVIKSKIQASEYRVILDEAQDTDPEQFEVLMNVVPFKNNQIKNGHFCMVGDPQQSIYGERADLSTYLGYHENLNNAGVLEILNFRVTFRADAYIVETVNKFFPHILNNKNGQVAFQEMASRIGAEQGQVVKCEIPEVDGFDSEGSISEKEKIESLYIAKWLRDKGSRGLGVGSWSDVAILCPRKDWLSRIANALQKEGVSFQIQSKNKTMGENYVYAWITALMVIINEPKNAFEIVGVLREIYGISDNDIAVFCQSQTLDISIVNNENSRIAYILNDLNLIYEKVHKLSVRELVNYAIEAVDLKSRLFSIIPDSLDEVELIIQSLLTKASALETKGENFSDFAEYLKINYSRKDEHSSIDKDAIQLLTCHSSKGLQWDVVILPFMARKISYAPDLYPRLIEYKDDFIAQIDSDHFFEGLREVADLKKVQEEERLLYVAMTRAKHTLIVVDDRSIFPKDENSFINRLRIKSDDSNYDNWLALPKLLKSLPEKDIQENAVQAVNGHTISLGSLNTLIVQEYSKNCIKRSTPSGLKQALEKEDQIVEDEADDHLLISNGADYGNWWHKMMELCPWVQEKDLQDIHFAECLKDSPDKERGNREIELFKESEVYNLIRLPNHRIMTEVPFIWSKDKSAFFEGIIDMFVWNTEKSECWVVDWKTDRVNDGGMDSLLELYAEQIKVYVQSLKDVTKNSIRGFIYSTRLGQLVEVKN